LLDQLDGRRYERNRSGNQKIAHQIESDETVTPAQRVAITSSERGVEKIRSESRHIRSHQARDQDCQSRSHCEGPDISCSQARRERDHSYDQKADIKTSGD